MMETGIEIQNGKYGRRLVVTSSWHHEFIELTKKKEIKELYLYTELGPEANLSFLTNMPPLEAFAIIDFTINDISHIHELYFLRSLGVTTYCKTAIDFTQFPLLEDCSLEWRAKAKSLFCCKTLKRIFLNRYSGKETSKFSELTELESLYIANAPIQDLNGLTALKKLTFLGLYNLRKLESLAGIEGLRNLQALEVNGCRSLTSIEAVKNLRHLRKLELCNDGDIPSLKPLAHLTKLNSFFFYESTNILDGDLSPLTKLPHLSKISFQNRRHYSHKREDFQI